MSPLSPRSVALPAAALAIILGLAQAHGQPQGKAEPHKTHVRHVTNCAAPAKILVTACTVAENASANVMR
jgi:hypothetical protein